ncbi:MAG: tRNA (adenosine(37)-N6)-dimethylallyltransferase MiaA, partial [Candidatus Obscuribacterales bacterium]|nr:tRNA (adenosine(37)-N6)-dimethylallyltransferase MiaA [Candidatus Obscuribacterales bacterium]
MSKQKVVAIVGPTCTGKTALSLAVGRQFPAEIIGCDSRNVYKYFDIGTAKPSAEEQAEIPHHLIDVAEPQEEFTAAEFARQASKAIDDISARKKIPIVCGGTGFYARALLEGLGIPDVPPQPELREQFKLLEENDKGSLYRKLTELDPLTATRLNANDLFRVIRALEVCIVSGKAFS